MKSLSLTLTGLLALSFLEAAAAPPSPAFYPLEEVRAGQRGYGKTVFQGTRVERFDFRVLGVLRHISPGQDMVLARVEGKRFERSGIFAGMSGSPVYIDGRLLGAVAFSFPFSKDPIAGITPIEQTADVFQEERIPRRRAQGRLELGDLYHPRKLLHLLLGSQESLLPATSSQWGATGLRPIATPLNLAGFAPRTIRTFAPYLQALGWVPAQGSGSALKGEFEETPVEPGSTVAVQLVRGDMEVSASGTVTYVSGNRLYAFGHPFLNVGYTDLPLSQAAVLTVMPNLMTSQKISATTRTIGVIRQDRSSGILGILGTAAHLVPVDLKLHTSRNRVREFHYQVVNDPFLTPFLMTFTVSSSISSSERTLGEQTLNVKTRIAVRGEDDVLFQDNVSDPSNGATFAALAAAAPVHLLMGSGFDNLEVERVEIEIHVAEQAREARLERIWVNKLEVRPGEEIELTVFLRKSNGELLSDKYPIQIPEEIDRGPLLVSVGDGVSLLEEDSRQGRQYVPRTPRQLIRAINHLKKNDRLYVRLYRKRPGAVVNGEGLPSLPPSLLALYSSRKTAGNVPRSSKVVYSEQELPARDFVLSGRQQVRIQIR